MIAPFTKIRLDHNDDDEWTLSFGTPEDEVQMSLRLTTAEVRRIRALINVELPRGAA